MDRQRLQHFLLVLACGIILAAVSRVADEETRHRFLAWTLGGYVGFLLCAAVVRRQLRHRRELARMAPGQSQAAETQTPRNQGGESVPIRSLFLLGDDRPDLVSIDDHGTLQGWSRADGSLLGSGYPGRDSAFTILLAPTERHLLAISWDGQLRAFDLEAGSARTWGDRVPYDPSYLHLLRETTWVGYAEETRFRLLNWSTGLEWEAIDQHRGPITSIASTRGLPLFATGARDGTIRVWDPLARTEPRIFSGHEYDIPAIAMDRTQNVIAGSAASGEIFVWDLDSALLRRRLP
ncbi:MAG: WD40 repeat domain-containing protein, partial [Candidatus Eisenbacteria bacterium]|nr:WD40 repeat domain-containing protein [Candidatus Eisenbacteria bacterium]